MAEHDTFVSTLTTVLYATSVGTVSSSEFVAGPMMSTDNLIPMTIEQAFTTAVVPISTVEVVTTVTVVTVTVSSVETSETSQSTSSPASPTSTQRE